MKQQYSKTYKMFVANEEGQQEVYTMYTGTLEKAKVYAIHALSGYAQGSSYIQMYEETSPEANNFRHILSRRRNRWTNIL